MVDTDGLELADTECENGNDDEICELEVAAPGKTHEQADEILDGESLHLET